MSYQCRQSQEETEEASASFGTLLQISELPWNFAPLKGHSPTLELVHQLPWQTAQKR